MPSGKEREFDGFKSIKVNLFRRKVNPKIKGRQKALGTLGARDRAHELYNCKRTNPKNTRQNSGADTD